MAVTQAVSAHFRARRNCAKCVIVHTSAVAVDGVEGLAEFVGRGSAAVMRCFIRSTGECRVWRVRGKLDLAVVPGCGPAGSLRAVAGVVEHGNIQHIRRGRYAC
jgi:hypothetical protein